MKDIVRKMILLVQEMDKKYTLDAISDDDMLRIKNEIRADIARATNEDLKAMRKDIRELVARVSALELRLNRIDVLQRNIVIYFTWWKRLFLVLMTVLFVFFAYLLFR